MRFTSDWTYCEGKTSCFLSLVSRAHQREGLRVGCLEGDGYEMVALQDADCGEAFL